MAEFMICGLREHGCDMDRAHLGMCGICPVAKEVLYKKVREWGEGGSMAKMEGTGNMLTVEYTNRRGIKMVEQIVGGVQTTKPANS